MTFHLTLIHQPELRQDDVNGEPEAQVLRERKSLLSLTLHLCKRIARREKFRDQSGVTVGGIDQVATLGGGLKCTMQRIKALPDMSCPRHKKRAEEHERSGFQSLQPALFDQVTAELTEGKSGLIVTEAYAGDCAKKLIVDA